MRLRNALLAASMVAAGGIGGVAVAAPASADLVTTCIGEGGAVTVPNDLVVPKGESCWLDGTTVQGDIEVRQDADLIVVDGTFEGSVDVASNAYLDTTKTSISGTVTATDAYGSYLDASSVDGAVQVSGDSQQDGFTYVVGSKLGDGLAAGLGEVLLDGSTVTGDVSGDGTVYTDLYDSSLDGALTVSGNELGSVVCESEIYGDAAYSGNSEVLQLGADGPLASCAGATYWGGNLDVSDNTATTVVSDNIIRGDLSGTGNDPAPVGENNRVRGTVSGQFEDLQPPATAMRRHSAQDREGALKSQAQDRRSQAKAEAHDAGSASL